MQHEFLGQISTEHIGNDMILISPDFSGGELFVLNTIGKIQQQDVGKRVYRVNGVIQVENNEQRDRRLGKA